MLLVMAAVWTRYLLITGMAFFRQEGESPAAPGSANQERIAARPAAQEENNTAPVFELDADSPAIDPTLVISSIETETRQRRLS